MTPLQWCIGIAVWVLIVVAVAAIFTGADTEDDQ